MSRQRQPARPGADAEEALAAALEELATISSVMRQPTPSDGGGKIPDLVLTLADGRRTLVEVEAMAHPGPAECRVLVERVSGARRQDKAITAVVADRLTLDAQKVLAGGSVSFFDRRGRLVLVMGDRIIEADVTPAPRPRAGGGGLEVRGVSGLSTALAALMSPDKPFGVREIARAAALSHTAVSQARAKLRDAHLLDGQFRPVLPELFEAIVAAWKWSATTETTLPAYSDRLVLAAGAAWDGPYYRDLGELAKAAKAGNPAGERRDQHAGWAMAGTRAAAEYGAAVVVGADVPASWIVPQDRYLTATRIKANEASGGAGGEGARLLGAPCPLAVRLRRPAPGKTALAHPLVIAIELARDRGRGREILKTFEPEGVSIVWR